MMILIMRYDFDVKLWSLSCSCSSDLTTFMAAVFSDFGDLYYQPCELIMIINQKGEDIFSWLAI